MRIFSSLYNKVMTWAAHRHAPWYLAGMSFAESSFFPVPPDVMLAPMVLAKRQQAWFYALLTTLASVIGGVFGYLIGMFAFELVTPLLHTAGYWHYYEDAKAWFAEWGFWVVFLAGFSPIPYKVFTIAAGTVGMALMPFVIASFFGRGARFFLVAALVRWGGPPVERMLKNYIDLIGWILVALAVIVYIVMMVI